MGNPPRQRHLSRKVFPILLTNRCNRRCLYCLNPSRNYDLSFEEVQRHIDDSAKLNMWDEIRFAGGEPTLRPDLAALLRYGKTSGFGVASIVTNATLISKDLCRNLVDSGLDFARASIPYHNEELSRLLCGSARYFRPSMEGIKNLKNANVPVGINLVLTSLNLPRLCEILTFFHEEIDCLDNICLIWCLIRGRAANHPGIIPTFNNARVFLGPALQFLNQKGVRFRLRDVPGCCVDKKYFGHLSFSHVQTEVYPISYVHMDECGKCALIERCPGILLEYSKLCKDSDLQAVAEA